MFSPTQFCCQVTKKPVAEDGLHSTDDLVAFLRRLVQDKKLDVQEKHVVAFEATEMNRGDVKGRSVEDVMKVLVIAGMAGAPANRIAEALCAAINGASTVIPRFSGPFQSGRVSSASGDKI